MTTRSRRSRARLPLQADFGLEALGIAEDRGDRERASRAPHAHEAVLGPDVAFDSEIVPFLCMADVGDLNVVVLAPEEGNRVEGLMAPEHVESRCLALPFRHDPMLDANGFTREAIRPARDVAGGENSRRARFEKGVDGDAAVDPEASGFCKAEARTHAEPGDDEIGFEASFRL